MGIPRGLEPLAKEARKYPTPEEFSYAYSLRNMHGRYWHLTEDPNFSIRAVSPRDLSSMGVGYQGEVGLMVSSNPEHWTTYFPERKYLAEIDLSEATLGTDYHDVARGFGHEIFVSNLNAARVKKVYPIKVGLREYNRYFALLEDTFQNPEDAYEFWREAQEIPKHHSPSLMRTGAAAVMGMTVGVAAGYVAQHPTSEAFRFYRDWGPEMAFAWGSVVQAVGYRGPGEKMIDGIADAGATLMAATLMKNLLTPPSGAGGSNGGGGGSW